MDRVATALTNFRHLVKQPNIWIGMILSSLCINILALALPLLFLQVYDRIIPNQAYPTLVLLILGVVSAILVENFLQFLRGMVNAWMEASYEYFSTSAIFEHLLATKERDFHQKAPGEHLGLMNSVLSLKDFHGGQLISSLLDLPFLILYLVLIACLGGWLVSIPLLVFSIVFLNSFLSGKNIQKIIEKRHRTDGFRMNFILEILTGFYTIKTMAMEAFMVRRYERLQKASLKQDYEMCLASNKVQSATSFLSQISMVLIVIAGSLEVIAGHLTMGTVAACTLLTSRALQPLAQLSNVWKRLQAIKLAKQANRKIFALPLENSEGSLDAKAIKGNLEVKNVCYEYEGQQIFNDLNLMIEAKSMTVITGGNSIERDTILKLLIRWDDLSSGTIRVDGRDVGDYNLHSLRKKIAYIPHKPIIFKGTILENLVNFSDHYCMEDVETIVEFLQMHKIIAQLPDGYDTMVDQKFTERYSTGFIQQITIARALLEQPQVILFSDIKTSVDSETKVILSDIIGHLYQSYTLVLISDDPKMKALADKCYRIHNKSLKEI